MNNTTAEPIFFATPAELRAWLHEHQATAREQWIGFHKNGSGRWVDHLHVGGGRRGDSDSAGHHMSRSASCLCRPFQGKSIISLLKMLRRFGMTPMCVVSPAAAGVLNPGMGSLKMSRSASGLRGEPLSAWARP